MTMTCGRSIESCGRSACRAGSATREGGKPGGGSAASDSGTVIEQGAHPRRYMNRNAAGSRRRQLASLWVPRASARHIRRSES